MIGAIKETSPWKVPDMLTKATPPKSLSFKLRRQAASVTAIVAVTAGFVAVAPHQAAAQEACSVYSVVPGDTLSEIAKAAEVQGGFQRLFDANRNVLANPNLVEVGMQLAIPCADGALPTSQTPVTTASVSTTPAPTTAQPDRALRIVTATGYAPFTDEDAPGGGLITQMVNRSMELGNADQEYDLMFINDWGSHLETLLPTGAVDMVFPWFKPNCDRVENLSPASALRCTNFNHSEPFYEALVGYYALQGSAFANATSYDDLIGARLCRPEAWFTFDIEAEGLMPPNVELVRPVPQNGCWQLLIDGEVDVITLDALPAEEDARELGVSDRIAKLDDLTSSVTMHVFVSKDNAFANEALPIINAGLEELRLSGEWFNIVREGIKDTVEN